MPNYKDVIIGFLQDAIQELYGGAIVSSDINENGFLL